MVRSRLGWVESLDLQWRLVVNCHLCDFGPEFGGEVEKGEGLVVTVSALSILCC